MKLPLATRRNLAALRDGVQLGGNALQTLAKHGFVERNQWGAWQIRADLAREFNRQYPRP